MSTTEPGDRLGVLLKGMTSAELAKYEKAIGDTQREQLGRAIARVTGEGWRATPLTMLCYLEPDLYKPWRYAQLLGEQFRRAAMGIEPHQIWEIGSQYGKTTSLVGGIIWLLDLDPTLRIMYLSYDARKAVEEGGRARDFALKHSDKLRFRLRSDSRARGAWKTDQGGGLYATGIGGAITGFPQDVLLLDDLIKGWQTAHSTAQREAAWNVYRSQARLRLQSSTNVIIHAGTRWHEDDIAARMMNNAIKDARADQWKVIRLPTIAEAPQPDAEDPLLREPDPLGRQPGELLEPERFPLAEVEARRAVLGSYLFAAMEQQRPAPEEGDEIKREWWRLESSMPTRYDTALTSWDMKMKDKEGGDFVVGQAWGRTGSDFWCFDQLRGQWNLVTTKTAIALMCVRHPDIGTHVIENTGNGPEVMSELRRPQPNYVVGEEVRSQLGITDVELPRVNAMFRRGIPGLVAENVKGDKVVRMRAQLGLVEAGNVHLPEGKDWAGGIVNESAAFPRGAHDDQVDCVSQALKRLRLGGASVPAAPSRPAASPKPSARARATIGRPRPRYR